jgi:hypothetical protein
MKVKFLKDVATKESKPQTFKKDQVVDFYEKHRTDPELKAQHGDRIDAVAHDLGQASARHWVNRGAAEEVIDAPAHKGKAESLVPGTPHKGAGGKPEAL